MTNNSQQPPPGVQPVQTYSTLTRKFVIALSGIGLLVYVILHLLGNLALYRSDQGVHFNGYAHTLHGWGAFLVAAEIALLVVFVIHAGWALYTKAGNLSARGTRYRHWRSKGGDTPSNLSSRNMVVSGSLILAFVLLHVWQFRFGPGIAEGYTADVNGEQVRDLYRLTVETLKNPVWAVVYLVAMALLGLHLRHGIWSSLQSLGLTRPRTTRALRLLCSILGIVLAIGFFLIPVWIFFGVPSQ